MPESWPQRFARAANSLLHPCGLHLVRRERALEMDGMLARCATRYPQIRTWIDVGASDGSWSLRARGAFPRASFLLFEPLAERQPALTALQRRHGFITVAAAAGAAAGTVAFAVDPKLDGSGIATPDTPQTRLVPMQTIAAAVAAHGLAGPYGIKLDTHGHEVPILEGAGAVLEQTSLLVIEAYNFKIAPSALRFHELCGWLEARGFRCCDLADPMRRPGDGALWQMDLAFARADHPLFASNRYAER
jgi:FkbM family methyltransferase